MHSVPRCANPAMITPYPFITFKTNQDTVSFFTYNLVIPKLIPISFMIRSSSPIK